jgi:cellulose synthase operon protein C
MDATIKAMTGLVDYQIADVTAAATFYMAETYFDFSRALKESERPADMKAADLEKFEADLDEAAYPFEDKAIKVHEKNMESLHAGVFNTWTEKSLSRLAEMVPGRYAKSEMSSGFIGTIDRYVYESPLAQAAIQAAAASNAATTPTNGGTAPTNAATTATNGTTPSNASATPNGTSTTPSNSGTTPSNTDQTTQPAPGAGTTPSKPDATHPAPMAANQGVVNQGAVKNANPQ